MLRTRFTLFYFAIGWFIGLSGYSQSFEVGNPLPVKPSLAGNYGELRPNHFHGGLDLKTGGREGMEVLAVEMGHIARVKVSPWGYGKALYIEHPNGYTTVYGHLKSFSKEIDAYVRQYQREQESFEIDLYPGKDDLPIEKGQVIALSGNTGGSGGPHLHFEVRETVTEVPRNPLLFGFPVSDSKAPVIEVIAVTPLGKLSSVNGASHPFRTRTKGESVMAAQPIKINGSFGIEVNGYDSQDGSYNRNGIYRVELWVDDKQVSVFTADSISFDLSRHLNALIDYGYYYKRKQRYLRLYRLPGNRLENLNYANDGILSLKSGEHRIAVRAKDHGGNVTEASFTVLVSETQSAPEENSAMIEWDVPYQYESERCSLWIPEGTLYASEQEDIQETDSTPFPEIRILTPSIPVQEPFQIRLKIPDSAQREGLLICQLNSSGKASRALSSSFDGGWIRAASRSFGTFTLVNDTKAPSIVPGNFRSGKSWTSGSIRFQVKDDLSGISTYEARIDGRWVIMEFDPKQDLMFIDVSQIPKSTVEQQLQLKITDMAGNVATFEGSLRRP